MDFLDGQKYKILKQKHGFKYNPYRDLQNMQNVMTGY